jgi:hemerythrin-like domain-containing protein
MRHSLFAIFLGGQTVEPTEILKQEHQIILMVLDAAEREARTIQDSQQIDASRVGEMVDFFRNFADRCHHAKEESLLFVRMQERGVPVEGGPIGMMLHEHEEGRRRLAAVANALPAAANGDPAAMVKVAENLLAYTRLLRMHIGKEDNVMYPLGDRLFTPEDQHELAEAFDRVEAEEIGKGVHEKYHEMAYRLGQ